jgi:hypothetical protein
MPALGVFAAADRAIEVPISCSNRGAAADTSEIFAKT